MAYIFDPLRNTFIDDEDTSLGNKLALVDNEEIDKVIKQIDDKFGPGTMTTLDQLPENKPAEVETTEQFNRFNRMYEDGGRVNFDNGSDPFLEELNQKLKQANINRQMGSIDFFINKFGEELLNKITQEKFGIDFRNLPTEKNDPKGTVKNFKRRLLKFEDFIKENNRTPNETEARKIGRIQRDKTITGTGTKEVTEEDIRNKLIEQNKPAETFKGKVIFADKNIQNEFEAELTKRYSFPRTSAAAEAAGVLNNLQIYKKFLEPAGYSMSSARTIIDDYKKFLDLNFQELTGEQKEAKKVEREKLEKISQGGRRISGTVDNPAHHMFPLGDQIGAKAGEFTVIPKSINGKIAYANKQMKKLILERRKILDKVKIDQTVNIKNLDKQLADINNKAEGVIKNHYKKYPSHKGLLNWKKIDFVLDDVGRLLNVRQVGTIGGDYKKWTLANIDQTILDKDVAKLNQKELRDFRNVVEETSVARDAGDKGFGAKEGTPIKNLFANLKTKLDTSRMFTSRIPGGAIALTPLDFILSYGSGMPLLESAASAGSYLIKDPYIGKFVNIPLAIAQDQLDPEATFKKAGERREKIENFLDDLTGTDSDKPFAPQLIEKLSNMKAGDQPDIDPFQAAKGGRAKLSKGGGVEISSMPRAEFGNGGAAAADDDFAAQLEYYFLNPDAELPAAQTFKETMNPIEIVNDMIDPRNFPYYADRLVESGVRIAEFGTRVLPAVGKLASDLIQKPAFKIKPASGQGYIRDYMEDIPPSNITGTGIFSEFLNNLVGSEGTKVITEKTGLAKLIKTEEQKMKDRRSTIGPKVLADQATLGMELTAPIFPGLKLLKAYAKNRNLTVDKTTREIMDKEIDEVLTKQGISRRDFMKVAGAGGAVAIAKLLGIGDDLATVTKVAEKAVPKASTVPPYFFTLVDKIKRLGTDNTKGLATVDREVVYVYKDYELYEDLSTGNIRITRKIGDETGYKEEEMVYTKGIGDESTQGTPSDEYDEFTVRADPDGKMKNIDNGLEELDDLIDEIGAENITIKDLEAMGYEIDRLPMAVQRKLGIQKPVSSIDRALKKSDDDLPDLPF